MSRRVALAFLPVVLVAMLSGCSAKDAAERDATDTTAESSTAPTQPSAADTSSTDTGAPDADGAAPISGPAASQAGSCPTQDEIDSMQSRMDEASSSATSSDD